MCFGVELELLSAALACKSFTPGHGYSLMLRRARRDAKFSMSSTVWTMGADEIEKLDSECLEHTQQLKHQEKRSTFAAQPVLRVDGPLEAPALELGITHRHLLKCCSQGS